MDVESCFGQSAVLFTSAVYIVCPFFSYSDLWAQPPPFAFLPFLLVLDIEGFCFLWHPPFLIFWRRGQKKRMKDWKFVEESFWRTFLDYVHKAQAAHSVNMARCQWDLFPWRLFLYSNNQGADSTLPQEKKNLSSNLIHPTPNILAVHNNKATREEIMRRYLLLLVMKTNILV